MSEYGNISTIILKNESSFSKNNHPANVEKSNNAILSKKMEIIPEQNEIECNKSYENHLALMQ